ncbi:MarR family winged helix-turn-helix transcriptional regulator [Streptomyces sp. NPDC093544]|uniref:MarR family winged helix-turn-helix transcriptional regulator n=1 Tax=Streptomyces sp. NPDC093544 TaxID=3155200 RepID=UPI0034224EC1
MQQVPTQQPQNVAGPASLEPLNSAEERLWRSLQKLLVALPRALDEDLLRSTGLPLTQYIVLMHLSETEGNCMRMNDLAAATALSASRVTRLVETLRVQGLVGKRRHSTDARGSMAVLTEAGRKRLMGAHPAHLASARRRVVDQLDPALVHRLADELQSVADPLLSRCRASSDFCEPSSVCSETVV